MNRTTHEIEPEEVMAYLDGELDASRASEVAAHIAGCAECAKVQADLRSVSDQLIQWQVETTPLSIAKSVEQEMAKPAPATRTASRDRNSLIGTWQRAAASQWAWKFGVASVAILLAGGVYLQRSSSRLTVVPRTATGLGNPAPSPQPSENGEFSRLELYSKIQNPQSIAGKSSADSTVRPTDDRPSDIDGAPAGPLIARTASMNLVVAKLDAARASLEKLLARHRGFTSEMTLDQSNDASASLNGTLQVPATELDAMLGELRGLGRVTTESQGGEDVSDQHVDLAVRLHNARASETRLLDILSTRTGKVGDVLEVEEQISKTRGEIEEMEAQLAGLDKRVAYASIKLQMGEEYKAPAGANGSVALRLRNAVVGGYRDAVDSLLALAVFLLSAGPTLLIWAFILFWPARAIWRRRGVLRGAFGKG
jgi:hypothetical protein